jgi:S-disulfanyl-L-cysteine oxidoreductase SoxD
MNAPRRVSSTGLLTCVILGLAAQEASHSVWDGVYTSEQAKRGEALYARECASCHGDLLTGGEQAPPLAGGEFLANWDGLTIGDLFERIRKTMPMNKPGKLSREVNADILAFMLAVNKFPAGKTELSHSTELLNQIRMEATKPNEGDKL